MCNSTSSFVVVVVVLVVLVVHLGSCSSMVEQRTMSFLYTGPMLIPETGMLLVLRNSRRASSEPSVDA